MTFCNANAAAFGCRQRNSFLRTQNENCICDGQFFNCALGFSVYTEIILSLKLSTAC